MRDRTSRHRPSRAVVTDRDRAPPRAVPVATCVRRFEHPDTVKGVEPGRRRDAIPRRPRNSIRTLRSAPGRRSGRGPGGGPGGACAELSALSNIRTSIRAVREGRLGRDDPPGIDRIFVECGRLNIVDPATSRGFIHSMAWVTAPRDSSTRPAARLARGRGAFRPHTCRGTGRTLLCGRTSDGRTLLRGRKSDPSFRANTRGRGARVARTCGSAARPHQGYQNRRGVRSPRGARSPVSTRSPR